MGITTVVMLGHQARVGKDTLAEILVREKQFIRTAFADALKDSVEYLYDLSHEQLYGSLKETMDTRYPNHRDSSDQPDYKPFLTPRRILQLYGQDQRSLYPNIWAELVFRDINRSEYTENYVITDFRFPNEYDVAKKWESESPLTRKLFVVKIERDLDKREAISGSTDSSETALLNFEHWDAVIQNNSSPEVLYNDFYHRYINHLASWSSGYDTCLSNG